MSSEFWSDQAAKAEAAAVKLSRRSVRHVADGGLVPLEVSVRGEAADALAADFARELLRAYPNIQEEDVEVMCDEALVALPQGGFGGMGCSTGVQAGLTARHPRKRMAALRLPSRPHADDDLPILVYRRGADGRLPILVSQLINTNHVRSHVG